MPPLSLFGLAFRTLRLVEPQPLLAQLERPEFAPVLAAAGAQSASAVLSPLFESDGAGRSLTLVGADRSGRVICLLGVREYRGIEGALEPLMILRPLRQGQERLREVVQRLVWGLATEIVGRPVAVSAPRDDRSALEAMLGLVGDVPIRMVSESWRNREAVVCLLDAPPARVDPLRSGELSVLRRIVSGERMMAGRPTGASPGSGGGRRTPPSPSRPSQRPPRPASVPARSGRTSRPAEVAGTLMTAEGFERLREELRLLRGEGRDQIAERLRQAREGGSSADDAEWDDVREDQMELEARIARIEAELRAARVVKAEEIDTETIGVGVRVTLHGDGRSIRYTLVAASEASPNDGRLSVESPLGAALIGRRAGEEVSVSTPRGQRRYLIDSISLPSAA